MRTILQRCSQKTLLVAVSVALVGLLAWQVIVMVGNRHDDSQRHDVVTVAQAQVLDLTTLDQATVKSKIARMSSRVTGDFKRQFDTFTNTFLSVVAQDKIHATGQIKSAALASYGSGSASVIVAATADISTSGKAAVTVRNYRFNVALSQINGKWLISGMEFVG